MSEAIFQTTGQALHVAFMVMANEARQGGPLRKALIQIMEQQASLSKRQRDWMNQLIGEQSGSVDFGGLTSDEIRGQCAMVTQIVKDHLTEPEMHVIHARFIPTATEEIGRDADRQPIYRFYFSRERVEALQWLSEWVAPNFTDFSVLQLDHLVTKAFAERKEVRHSFRDLSDQFKIHHMKFARVYPKLVAHLKFLEAQAINRLTPMFLRTSLIEQVEECC